MFWACRAAGASPRPIGEDSFAVSYGGNETKIAFTRDAAGQVESASFGFRIVRKVKTA